MATLNPGFVVMGQRLGKETLFSYIEKFGFDEQVMLSLFSYCIDKIGNISRNYIQTVAERLGKK